MRADSEIAVENYQLKKISSSEFTNYKYPDPTRPGKYLDEGKCKICGILGQRLLVRNGLPVICYKCYQALRNYKTTLVDVLNLRSRKQLTLKQCKLIVRFMKDSSEVVSAAAKGVVAASILEFLSDDN